MGDGQPEQNPFAAPLSGSDTADVFLSDDQSFRVIDRVLYCRSTLSLTDVCWLTGETQDLVGTVKKTVKASPPWLNTTYSVFMIGLVATYLTLNAMGVQVRYLVSLVYPMLIANLVLQSWLGIKVDVVLGQSQLAKAQAAAARKFGRAILACMIGFPTAAAIAYLLWGFAYLWALIVIAILVAVYGVVFYIRHSPGDFSVFAMYHSEGVFKLVGLRPEFLAAVSHYQS